METGVFINFKGDETAFIEKRGRDRLTGKPEIVFNLYQFAMCRDDLNGFAFELLLHHTEQEGRFEVQNIRKVGRENEELTVENGDLMWQTPRTRYSVPLGEYSPAEFIQILDERRIPLSRLQEQLFITTVQEPKNILICAPPFQAVLHTIGFNLNQDLSAKEFQLDEEKAQKVKQQLRDFELVEGQDFVQHFSPKSGYFYVLTSDKIVEKYYTQLRRVRATQPQLFHGVNERHM